MPTTSSVSKGRSSGSAHDSLFGATREGSGFETSVLKIILIITSVLQIILIITSVLKIILIITSVLKIILIITSVLQSILIITSVLQIIIYNELALDHIRS